jgi:stage V sporulation protein G
MTITEITVDLADAGSPRSCLAFCSVTFDGAFAVHDIKVIQRADGSVLVAMPSRELSDRCPGCRHKCPMRSRYCMTCGRPVSFTPRVRGDGRTPGYADIAHPITPKCREAIHAAVVAAYSDEAARFRPPPA